MTESGLIPSDTAYERHLRIVALREVTEKTFLALGAELYEFNRKHDYISLGHPSMNSYLADPDVDINRRAAYRLTRIHRIYVEELGCDTVALLAAGISKLDLMSVHVDAENVDEWLANAAALSRSDLRQEMEVAGLLESGNSVNWRQRAWVWKRAAKKWWKVGRRGLR